MLYSQVQVKPDSRLYQCFSEEYLKNLETSNPKLIAYYNFYLDHSYFISTGKSEKKVDGNSIFSVKYKEQANKYFDEDIKVFSTQKFNPLKYDFKIEKNLYSHYLIDDKTVLIFYPMKRFMKEYKKYLIELGFQE